MLALTLFVACVFGMSKWLVDDGGFFITIPLAAIPFALLVEWMLNGRPKFRPAPAAPELTTLHGFVLAVAFVPDASVFIIAGFNWKQIPLLIEIAVFGDLMHPIGVFAILIPASFVAWNWWLGHAVDPQPVPLRIPALLLYITVFTTVWLFHSFPHCGLPYETKNLLPSIGSHFVALTTFWVVWAAVRKQARVRTMLSYSVALHCWLFSLAFPLR